LLFFETSAKTGEGVVEVFTEIGKLGCNSRAAKQSLTGLFMFTAKKIPLDALIAQSRGPGGAARPGARGQQGAASNVDLTEGEAGKKDACAC